MLPMIAEPCFVALLTVFGFTSVPDDHHEHTTISSHGSFQKVLFIEYLNGDPQQLNGLVRSAFIHGSRQRREVSGMQRIE